MRCKIFAGLRDRTFLTFGTARLADVTSVQKYPEMGRHHQFMRDVALQLLLHLERRIGGHGDEPYAAAHAIDMCVHGQSLAAESHGEHHIGRLAPHAGKRGERLEGVRHLAAVVGTHLARHGHEVGGLAVGIGHVPDERQHVGLCGGGQALHRRERRKERGRHHVDPLVRALRREHHGHQQFVGRTVLQLRLDGRNVGLEII